MSASPHGDARLNFRIAPVLKRAIEEAATQLGQTVSDFAVSTLTQAAETVLERKSVTELSRRDRDLFIALVDNKEAKPNAALTKAFTRYQEHFRRKAKDSSRPRSKSSKPRSKR